MLAIAVGFLAMWISLGVIAAIGWSIPSDQDLMELPAWFAPLFYCGPPLVGVAVYVLIRPRRPKAEGICSNCNYDLRATPDRGTGVKKNQPQMNADARR